MISLKGLITGTLQWKRLHCLHLMEAFITKNNLLFILGKKYAAVGIIKCNVYAAMHRCTLNLNRIFIVHLFFLDMFNTCKTSLISLEIFFYWVIKLNAFNFQCTALLQPFKFKKLLTEPEIITRLDEYVVFQNCETNCRHTVKQSPTYATPPSLLNSFIIIRYPPTASSSVMFCVVTTSK